MVLKRQDCVTRPRHSQPKRILPQARMPRFQRQDFNDRTQIKEGNPSSCRDEIRVTVKAPSKSKMPVSSITTDRHPVTDEAFPYFHATSSGDLPIQSHTLTDRQKCISEHLNFPATTLYAKHSSRLRHGSAGRAFPSRGPYGIRRF